MVSNPVILPLPIRVWHWFIELQIKWHSSMTCFFCANLLLIKLQFPYWLFALFHKVLWRRYQTRFVEIEFFMARNVIMKRNESQPISFPPTYRCTLSRLLWKSTWNRTGSELVSISMKCTKAFVSAGVKRCSVEIPSFSCNCQNTLTYCHFAENDWKFQKQRL